MAYNAFKFDTLSEIFQFLAWLKRRGGKHNTIANMLVPRFLPFLDVSKRNLQFAMQRSLNNLIEKMTTLHEALLSTEIAKLGDTYAKLTQQEILHVILDCIPKLYAALSFLLYNVSDNYKSVGGGSWANQNATSTGSDLCKYLTSTNVKDYNGIIPGGFNVIELKNQNGKALVRPLTEAVTREGGVRTGRGKDKQGPPNHFTNVLATTLDRPWQDVNTGNALLLMRAFQDIVVAEGDGSKGGLAKEDWDKDIHPKRVCWADLYKHFSGSQTPFKNVFNDGGFGFTGQVYNITKKKEFAEMFSKWFKTNYQHIKKNLQKMSEKTDDSDVHLFATTKLYPYGLIFKYDGKTHWENTLKTHWSNALSMFNDRGHELERLKNILEGLEKVKCLESSGPVATKTKATKTEAAKPVVTKTEISKPTATRTNAGRSKSPHKTSNRDLDQSARGKGTQNQNKKAEKSSNQIKSSTEHKSPDQAVVKTAATQLPNNDGTRGPTGPKSQGPQGSTAENKPHDPGAQESIGSVAVKVEALTKSGEVSHPTLPKPSPPASSTKNAGSPKTPVEKNVEKGPTGPAENTGKAGANGKADQDLSTKNPDQPPKQVAQVPPVLTPPASPPITAAAPAPNAPSSDPGQDSQRGGAPSQEPVKPPLSAPPQSPSAAGSEIVSHGVDSSGSGQIPDKQAAPGAAESSPSNKFGRTGGTDPASSAPGAGSISDEAGGEGGGPPGTQGASSRGPSDDQSSGGDEVSKTLMGGKTSESQSEAQSPPTTPSSGSSSPKSKAIPTPTDQGKGDADVPTPGDTASPSRDPKASGSGGDPQEQDPNSSDGAASSPSNGLSQPQPAGSHDIKKAQDPLASSPGGVSSSVPSPVGGSGNCDGLPKDTNQRDSASSAHVTPISGQSSVDQAPDSSAQTPKMQSPQPYPVSTPAITGDSQTDNAVDSGSSTSEPSVLPPDPNGSGTKRSDTDDDDAKGATSPSHSHDKTCVHGRSPVNFGGVTLCQHTRTAIARTVHGHKTPNTLWDEYEKEEEKRRLNQPFSSKNVIPSLYSNPGRHGNPTNYSNTYRFRYYTHKSSVGGHQIYPPPDDIPLHTAYRNYVPIIGYEGPDMLNPEDPDEEWQRKQTTLQRKEFRDKNDKILSELKMQVLTYSPPELPKIGIAVGNRLNPPRLQKKVPPSPPSPKLLGKPGSDTIPESTLVTDEEAFPSNAHVDLVIEKPNTEGDEDTTVMRPTAPLQKVQVKPARPITQLPSEAPSSFDAGEEIQDDLEEEEEQDAPNYRHDVVETIDVCRDPWHISPSSTYPDQPTQSPPPSADNLPTPNTVRGILYWLVGLVALEYVGIIHRHVEGMLRDFDKAIGIPAMPQHTLNISLSELPLVASAVTRILTEACYYAASVLCRLKHIDISNAIKDFDFAAEYSQLHYAADPAALLCQLRDYVYAAHHQLAFLRLQCYRDEAQGGWKDFEYGSNVGVSSSTLQAFLTDGWDSKFNTHLFDAQDVCYQSRIRMGFSDADLPKETKQGSLLSSILSPKCDPYDPLMTLASYLVCLTTRTPRTTAELISFFHHLGNALYEFDPDILSDVGSSLIDHPVDYFFWAHIEEADLLSIREIRGCDPLIQCHDHHNTLSNLIGCDIYPIPCPQQLLPITYPTYALYSPTFVPTYLSWMVYLPDRLQDALDRLRRDLKYHTCYGIKPLHMCSDAVSTLYFHGFAPPYDALKRPPNCSDVTAKLSSVLSGGPISKLLTCMDDFLYRGRKPFVTLVFTLWSIAIVCLIHTQLYRLDVFRIGSHLIRSKASHFIDVKALLTPSRKMLSLYDADYFDDADIAQHYPNT
ncbi:hypothetical protein BBBOND_0208940 [Babesia bigemina]|uniref:Ribosome binding protein n=1 Tax=Babesia bigemina TaxID=5866 RepID=A0A061DCS5_BABBI|nr:hypothetical protein BBBOND_0208940 [Babesia bigemina]CDR95740.1 hypothetical protein BBBOND_0208940 [Babesia bigemina]|eukprot:XP_012767926.1 hypothetical protein BBBOND_0208940 [Babesia bigemina]